MLPVGWSVSNDLQQFFSKRYTMVRGTGMNKERAVMARDFYDGN